MSHYFVNDPNLKSDIRKIKIDIFDTSFTFEVDRGVFSQNRLDIGTKILLESFVMPTHAKTIIDMGSGYGPIAVTLASQHDDKAFFAYDINKRAVKLTSLNGKLNGVTNVNAFESNLFENVKVNADVILTNPPIRTGKENIFELYEKAYQNLNQSGELWLVIRNQQGAESTKKKIEEIFGNCYTIYKKKGYRVFKAVKS